MNKISEKAVWDNLPPSDDETLSSPLYGQPIQPQMMFCYKCSQVIPANSAYCPWCQTELFITCPKCGNKYSSQYPSCNHCGVNRSQYLEEERQKKERLQAQQKEEFLKQQEEREKKRREAAVIKEREVQKEIKLRKKRKLTRKYDIILACIIIIPWLAISGVTIGFLVSGVDKGTVGIGGFFLTSALLGLLLPLLVFIFRPLENRIEKMKRNVLKENNIYF